MALVYFFMIIFISMAWGKSPGVCELIDVPGCHGITKQLRRSSSASLPSPASAANINPATVSFDRGFGVEAIHQAGNPVSFNVASGTGKVGGALISHSLENSFFGNRIPEIDDNYATRRVNKTQYDAKKLNLAFAKKVVRKGKTTLDAGVLFKRHSQIKRVNPGLGLSGRIGPLSWGASVYQDDFRLELKDFMTHYHQPPYYRLPYAIIHTDVYTERFMVQAYTAGINLGSLTLDAGLIMTKYKFYEEDTKISLYSAGWYYKNLLLNLGIRNEHSPAMAFDSETETLEIQRRKNSTYMGIQASLSRHIIFGIQYNYFLLKEISLTSTLFF